MKYIVWSIVLFFLCSACANESTNTATSSSEQTQEVPSKPEIEKETEEPEVVDRSISPSKDIEEEDLPVIDNENLTEELSAFIPDGYSYLGHKYGDLNKDDLKTDAILALKNNQEENSTEELLRPLLILSRQADNSLQLEAQNDNVVYCSACGGTMGDPFQDIAIKNGYFSVEHYGGSRFRWFSVTTFKYDSAKKDWFLHKQGTETTDSLDPDQKETATLTAKDFGRIAFKDFESVE